MKEATGELNLTIIVVIAVGLLIAFFYYTIWPVLDNNFKANSSCSKAICDNPCGNGSGVTVCNESIGQLVPCHLPNEKDNIIYCPWKG